MKPQTKALAIGAILIVVFGVSFFFFYKRVKNKNAPIPLFVASKVINQRLPKTNLVSSSGQSLDDEKLRHGKIVLAIMMPDCGPCDQENEFLKTVIDSRKDVRFFYLIPFGNKNAVLKLAQSKYALDPVYDNGSNVARTLEINQVPIKLFLEDGIIRRTWVDATVTPEKQSEFKNWLRDFIAFRLDSGDGPFKARDVKAISSILLSNLIMATFRDYRSMRTWCCTLGKEKL